MHPWLATQRVFSSTFPKHQFLKLTLGKKLGLPVATANLG